MSGSPRRASNLGSLEPQDTGSSTSTKHRHWRQTGFHSGPATVFGLNGVDKNECGREGPASTTIQVLGGLATIPNDQAPRPPTPPQRRDPTVPRTSSGHRGGFDPQRFIDTRPLRKRLIIPEHDQDPGAAASSSTRTSQPQTSQSSPAQAEPTTAGRATTANAQTPPGATAWSTQQKQHDRGPFGYRDQLA